jgi:hypothetical protein
MIRTVQAQFYRCRGWLVVLAVVATLAPPEAAAQTRGASFLGLTGGFGDEPEFWEGRTNYRLFLRPRGVVKAVMLFARFPDAESEESTQDLYQRLVPEGAAFFRRASYGQMTLTVDARHRWISMAEASTLVVTNIFRALIQRCGSRLQPRGSSCEACPSPARL